ncbi:hypothetical protein JYU34_008330 [Plutella xylostella]|uniref:Uncharacterized protein n=1 Tax=Plutella xylostella TaxID=51655 RepID=A0ABQ7QPB4_PLUXY|nr:hypothetical protein JYU34_008330 [Plutella xylostella]
MKRNKVPPDDATAHDPEDMPGTPDGTTSEDDLPGRIGPRTSFHPKRFGEGTHRRRRSTQLDGTTVPTPTSLPISLTHQIPKHLKTNTRESTPKSPSHKTPKPDENEPPDPPSPDPDSDEDETDWKKQEWTQKPDQPP